MIRNNAINGRGYGKDRGERIRCNTANEIIKEEITELQR